MDNKTVLNMQEYGRIKLTLRERLDERGMTRYRLARSIGVRFEVVDKWYRGEVSSLDLDILSRICFVLECSVSDLLIYQPAAEDE